MTTETQSDVIESTPDERAQRLSKYLHLVEDEEDKLENQSEKSAISGLSEDSEVSDEELDPDSSLHLHDRVIERMIPPVWSYGTNYLHQIFQREVMPGLQKNLQESLQQNLRGDFKRKIGAKEAAEHEKKLMEDFGTDERFKGYNPDLNIRFDLTPQESKILISQLRNTFG